MRNMNILYYIYLSFQTLYVRITYIHEKTYINFIHTEILILILNSDHLQYSILAPTLFAQWTKGQWPHGQWPCAIHPNCATLVTCLSSLSLSRNVTVSECQQRRWWPVVGGDRCWLVMVKRNQTQQIKSVSGSRQSHEIQVHYQGDTM